MTAPLVGWRVAVSAIGAESGIADAVRDAGADVTRVEWVATVIPEANPSLDAAVADAARGGYDWLAVTSRAAVAAVTASLARVGVDAEELGRAVRVAAVGSATARACAEAGWEAARVPSGVATASALAAAMPPGPGRVLAPLGDLAGPDLVDALSARGWDVNRVEAYRTQAGPGADAALRWDLENQAVDAVVLTSGSAAQQLAGSGIVLAPGVAVVAIGATTAARCAEVGLAVAAVAAEPTPASIVEALAALRKDRP